MMFNLILTKDRSSFMNNHEILTDEGSMASDLDQSLKTPGCLLVVKEASQ